LINHGEKKIIDSALFFLFCDYILALLKKYRTRGKGQTMSFNYLVSVKQVPDTKNITGQAMKPDGTVNRAALPAIFNPEDLNALELALQLREKFGGKVTVVTMGPPTAAEVLRQALYRGADKVALLTDKAFAGADTLATSYALSCFIKNNNSKFDVILCGRQAIDGDTAQVGPQLAEKLAYPQICYVEEIQHLSKNKIKAKRSIDGGFEIIESTLPVLLTVVDANEPRPPSINRIMKYKKAKTRSELHKIHLNADYTDAEFLATEEEEAKKKSLWIEEIPATDIKADIERVGLKGSPTKVKNIESVVLKSSEMKKIEAAESGINALIHELIQDHILG
jgi:electron transfer flavoprotein beta subunit